MKNTNIKQIMIFAGAILAYMMGSGFATGQELLQYYVPFGYKAILVGIVVSLILIFANTGFAYAGKTSRFQKGSQVFTFYCGPIFGKFFDWFATAFCFMSFIVMVAGAGSTLAQQYSLPLPIGAIFITIAAVITVNCGLNSVVKILGRLGPLLAVLVLGIGIVTLLSHAESIDANITSIDSNAQPILRASANWFFSGVSYAGMSLLIIARFLEQLGREQNFPRLVLGQTVGIVIYVATSILIAFALIANINTISNAQIPTLVLATNISPHLGAIFSLIIITAIYTTACPLLWTASSRLAKEGSHLFKVTTWLLAIFGAVIALFIPFNILINYIYVLNGYAGAVIVLFMIGKFVIILLMRKHR